ncbi:MAG: hypothetical protein P8Q31_03440 [Luminiphilus sp.]|nr:hypothetical protein [Luminiphilus sp.]
MRAVTTAFRSSPLHQQLAATACLCCLISSLALVALAAQSSSHSQANLQSEYGKAVAEQLARRLGVELATGDRLGIAGELSKLTEQQSIVAARALDVDKRELAAVGKQQTSSLIFQAPIVIAGDQAGIAEVALNTAIRDSTQLRFVLSLSGLAILLSIAVYLTTRTLALRVGKNLQAVAAELGAVGDAQKVSTNEIEALRERVAALPLDLLRPPSEKQYEGNQHYVETAILFIHFRSLPGYLETVDERRLQRYVAHVHRMIYGASGFYNGELQVVRQFGIAVWFTGKHKIASPTVRAASCAWLIQQTAPRLEQQLRLSVGLGLAVGDSELGRGDSEDIYPGLYTQAAVDELEALARQSGNEIHLFESLLQDVQLINRVSIEEATAGRYQLGKFADGHRDLLERQREILLRALITNDQPEE